MVEGFAGPLAGRGRGADDDGGHVASDVALICGAGVARAFAALVEGDEEHGVGGPVGGALDDARYFVCQPEIARASGQSGGSLQRLGVMKEKAGRESRPMSPGRAVTRMSRCSQAVSEL